MSRLHFSPAIYLHYGKDLPVEFTEKFEKEFDIRFPEGLSEKVETYDDFLGLSNEELEQYLNLNWSQYEEIRWTVIAQLEFMIEQLNNAGGERKQSSVQDVVKNNLYDEVSDEELVNLTKAFSQMHRTQIREDVEKGLKGKMCCSLVLLSD